ncbi:hypothetical protein CFH99_12240 [Nocardioides aromaticivorans]|uniref:Uncharacterized protein n=1 Tax=Nocardioides aromaticivorans TaxID=200618 RepID=A0ABX7PL71_9ACTN|nr:hypothetical protein [Nocardioides aromaticivorans]QSR26395.1 hypothetical protein CFH99_12240 [Nocardioides aromaticivorans]
MTRLGWIVAGAVALVLLLAGSVTALVVASGGDPTSVEEVADAAVDAAQDLDVDDGVDLLCEAPSGKDRADLEKLIETVRDETGEDDPDATYEISDVEGDTEGSFTVRVTSDEEPYTDAEIAAVVHVQERDGRSCISGFDPIS